MNSIPESCFHVTVIGMSPESEKMPPPLRAERTRAGATSTPRSWWFSS